MFKADLQPDMLSWTLLRSLRLLIRSCFVLAYHSHASSKNHATVYVDLTHDKSRLIEGTETQGPAYAHTFNRHVMRLSLLCQVSSAKPPSKPVGHSSHEERLELLRAELEVKSQMLSEVKKHLREAAERERHLQALSQDAQVHLSSTRSL